MATIVVTPASPQEFEHRDFEELTLGLVQQTGVMADAIEFRLGYLYGDGLPDWTVITVIVDEAGRAALGAVIAATVEWARRWWKAKSGRRPPRIRFIYGPTGEVLREVKVRGKRSLRQFLRRGR